MASSATVSAPKKRKSFSEYFHSMRGQQLIVTLVFLFVPLVLLFMFTYLPFFKMVEFSFFKMKYIGRRTLWVCRTTSRSLPAKTASTL